MTFADPQRELPFSSNESVHYGGVDERLYCPVKLGRPLVRSQSEVQPRYEKSWRQILQERDNLSRNLGHVVVAGVGWTIWPGSARLTILPRPRVGVGAY